jgi:cell division septal protein FtsQ
MAKFQRWRRSKKRRFETAGTLVVGRARVPAPARSLRWLRWGRWVLPALVVVIVGAALWALLDDRFYVYHADVVGTVRLSPDQIFEASDMPGCHVLWVNPAKVEADILAALPSLESAEVVCRLPSNCTITVVERQPRMIWNDGEQLWGVDANGVIFPSDVAFTEAWVVRGPLPKDEDGLLAEPARVALAELWASGVEMSPELAYVPSRGFVITDGRGWRVIVGEGAGMDERLQALEAVATHLEARGITPKFVDVRFPKAPYYSVTNDW